MARIETSTVAPEIALDDHRGERFELSSLRGHRHVILVFNRGFV